MGFDIYGRAPRSAHGEYFRNAVWDWHPLADYVLEHVTIRENDPFAWHRNVGHVVPARSAAVIAAVLTRLIESGHAARYAERREKLLRDLPDQRCDICDGTGRRSSRSCNACGGKGAQPRFKTLCRFSVDNVAEFAIFCRDSGGFEIC